MLFVSIITQELHYYMSKIVAYFPWAMSNKKNKKK